ncbi:MULTISPECIES: LysR substrate-binding domain-containing protein [unclassified Sphingomonas]|jgi:LysR family glycine cleavage system transcriptional activator|uniref:LysR substrate-binding domain-containing protein n=1 Tax=unclassified Sphingomonas TaxID=196159 RepID=UPI0008325701|nr:MULTISPECIES: LysR substrate-binding domain-containing protein [unclassified Sphingomonas]
MNPRASLNVSLNALRVFEAVVRLGGVNPAAAELGLTASAISHQLKALDAAMPLPLLRREGRRAVPTAQGAKLAAQLGGAFAAIDDAVDDMRSARQVMTISAYDSFAVNWLLPRLARFTESRPEIDVRLATSPRLLDLERERIDCAIRLGPGGWPGIDAHLLVPQYFGPLVRSDRADGATIPRILWVGCEDDWDPWPQLQHGGQEIRVMSRELVIGAVMAGTGMGVLDLILMSDRIANREVTVSGPRHASPWSYYLALPAGRRTSPHVRAFADWVREEMGRTERFLNENVA